MGVLSLFRQKISPAFIFSTVFFLLCMSLDFYITTSVAGGDFTMEANAIAKWWWELMGPFRFIEIPVYSSVILGTAYAISLKNTFIPLLWLNVLAFNHLLGFLSWFSTPLDMVYTAAVPDWAIPYVFSCISLCLALPLAFVQTKLRLYAIKK